MNVSSGKSERQSFLEARERRGLRVKENGPGSGQDIHAEDTMHGVAYQSKVAGTLWAIAVPGVLVKSPRRRGR